jgi:hypothetical protein
MFSLRVQLGAEFLDDWIGGRQPCMRHLILEAALFQRCSHLVGHAARREFRPWKNYSIYGENSIQHRFEIMSIVRCRTPIDSKSTH